MIPKYSFFVKSIAFAVVMISLWRCESPPNPHTLNPLESIPSDLREVQKHDYDLSILTAENHPYAHMEALTVESIPHDTDDSVRMGMILWEGERYYHPVRMAQRMLGFWRSLQETEDEAFHVGIDHILIKLFEIGIWQEDAIFFPYSINIYPHAGRGVGNNTMMRKPWFSGMAQGQVLSVLSLMYQETDDVKYLEWALPVFNSFTILNTDSTPWVTHVDTAGFLWVEEYPLDTPSHVLNGFIYAVFGFYDYYACDPNDEVRKHFLSAGITTVENNVARYRNVGSLSFYCLIHDYSSEFYHHLHIEQLRYLSQISNNDYFQEISNYLEDDF